MNRRGPLGCLAVATAVALVLLVPLMAVVLAPVSPGCFEYCNLGQTFATIGIAAVGLAWMATAIAVAWLREPALTPFALLVACAFLVATTLSFALNERLGPIRDLVPLILVMSLGFQLPPIWRLAAESRHRPLARIASWVAGGAVGLGSLGLLFGGVGPLSGAYAIVGVAFIVFLAALAVLALVTIEVRASSNSGAIGIIAVGSLIPFASLAFRTIGVDAGQVVILTPILLVVGWLWIGFIWYRGGSGIEAEPVSCPA
jgi:hypothetical protein